MPSPCDPGLFEGGEIFDTREECLAAAKELWGADDEGRICIINELGDDEDEEDFEEDDIDE